MNATTTTRPDNALAIINAADLAARTADGSIGQFWNVLTNDYFTGELIPGSRHVPLDIVGRVASPLERNTVIVVYCSGITCPNSRDAANKLVTLGFTNVALFEGGLTEWKVAGHVVETVTQQVSATASV